MTLCQSHHKRTFGEVETIFLRQWPRVAQDVALCQEVIAACWHQLHQHLRQRVATCRRRTHPYESPRRAMISSAWLLIVCIDIAIQRSSAFLPPFHRRAHGGTCATLSCGDADDVNRQGSDTDGGDDKVRNTRILIYWRGEALEDYSKDFRL